jgi:hypothetical protein
MIRHGVRRQAEHQRDGEDDRSHDDPNHDQNCRQAAEGHREAGTEPRPVHSPAFGGHTCKLLASRLKQLGVVRPHMSVEGLCEICGEDTVIDRCDRCGSLVCERHAEPARGLCVECIAELEGKPQGSQEPGQSPDDVDTYQF